MFNRLRIANRKDLRRHADYTALPEDQQRTLLSALTRFVSEELQSRATKHQRAFEAGEESDVTPPSSILLKDLVAAFSEHEDYHGFILSMPQTYAFLKHANTTSTLLPGMNSPLRLTESAGTPSVGLQ